MEHFALGIVNKERKNQHDLILKSQEMEQSQNYKWVRRTTKDKRSHDSGQNIRTLFFLCIQRY